MVGVHGSDRSASWPHTHRRSGPALAKLSGIALLAAPLPGCLIGETMQDGSGTGPAEVNDLTAEQALADFRQLVAAVRAAYGPLEYKEERFQFRLDGIVQEAEAALAQAKGDASVFSIWARFLDRFEDGHVRISFAANASPVQQHSIPCFAMPVQDTALITRCDEKEVAGVAPGDELLAIGGETVVQLAEKLEPYVGTGNPESDRHVIYSTFFSRPVHAVEAVPANTSTTLSLRRQDGTTYEVNATWKVREWVEQRGRRGGVPGR
jgi:hypothetical protein